MDWSTGNVLTTHPGQMLLLKFCSPESFVTATDFSHVVYHSNNAHALDRVGTSWWELFSIQLGRS